MESRGARCALKFFFTKGRRKPRLLKKYVQMKRTSAQIKEGLTRYKRANPYSIVDLIKAESFDSLCERMSYELPAIVASAAPKSEHAAGLLASVSSTGDASAPSASVRCRVARNSEKWSRANQQPRVSDALKNLTASELLAFANNEEED